MIPNLKDFAKCCYCCSGSWKNAEEALKPVVKYLEAITGTHIEFQWEYEYSGAFESEDAALHAGWEKSVGEFIDIQKL